eukprot:1174960-Amphidinium_carterae.1
MEPGGWAGRLRNFCIYECYVLPPLRWRVCLPVDNAMQISYPFTFGRKRAASSSSNNSQYTIQQPQLFRFI